MGSWGLWFAPCELEQLSVRGMIMSCLTRVLSTLLVTVAGSAAAQDGSGLLFSESRWLPLKSRSPTQLVNNEYRSSSSLVRDFSLDQLSSSIPQGMRVTGGVVWGNTTLLTSVDNLAGTYVYVDQRLTNPNILANIESRTIAFLGIGHTKDYADSGWRLNTDLGMTMEMPTAGPSFNANGYSLQNTLRDAKFGPLIRLRISYSF